MGTRKLTGAAGPVTGAEDVTIDPVTARVVTALMRMYDGAAWQRLRTSPLASNPADTVLLQHGSVFNPITGAYIRHREARTDGGAQSEGAASVVPHLFAATDTFTPLLIAADALANNNIQPAALQTFNGVGWDRQRGNAEVTVLASAGNAAGTRTSADQTNHNARGVVLVLDITALGAAETLTLIVDAKDPVSAIYVGMTAFVDSGVDMVYALYPGAVETAAVVALQVQGVPLPRTWRVRVTTSPGVNASTFSVGASYVL